MTDERKQELFPYFAYTYSKQINPEKYGNLSSDEWQTSIQDSPEDIDQISQAAGQLADEDWDALDLQYSQEQPQEQQAQYAAKGAKIKKLKSMKCGCGCNMVTVKEEGGKMSSKCACNCGGKMKHQKGGVIKAQKGASLKQITDNTISAPGKLVKGLQGKVHLNLGSNSSNMVKSNPLAPRSTQPIGTIQMPNRAQTKPQGKTTVLPTLNVTAKRLYPNVLPTLTVTAKRINPLDDSVASQSGNISQSKNRVGSKTQNAPINSKVVEWQKKLLAEGFDLGKTGADGKWGKKTEAAYQSYLQNRESLSKVGLLENHNPLGFDVAPAKYPTTFNKQGGQINNKKSNNMKENLGSIQSILDSFKKGGKMKCQNGGDLSPKATVVAKNGSKVHQRIKTETKSAEIETAKCGKKLVKKQVGGKVKASINTAASATSKLPKMNAQSGANSSTVPTNPDGSAKAPNRIKKGQEGFATKTLVKPKPKKNVLPVVNGKKVPDDGADYSVQGPANKSEKVNKNKK